MCGHGYIHVCVGECRGRVVVCMHVDEWMDACCVGCGV